MDKRKTVFINYDLSTTYELILSYPVSGHLDIFLFKLFNFSYFINLLIFYLLLIKYI